MKTLPPAVEIHSSDNNIDPNQEEQIYSDSSNPTLDSNSYQISSASPVGDGTAPGGIGVTGTTASLSIMPSINDETSPAAPVAGAFGPFPDPGSTMAANPIMDYSTSLEDSLMQAS